MRQKVYYILTGMLFIFAATSVVAGGGNSNAAALHTFHTSLMNAEYNEQEKTLEISIQVFAHDLENILGKRSGKRVRLDRTPDAGALTLRYLSEAVNLKNREGELKPFSWVGMESQADAVWLYVETKMPEGLEGAHLRNRIFFDLLGDQVNLVHIKYEGKKADLVFKPGEDYKAIVATKTATADTETRRKINSLEKPSTVSYFFLFHSPRLRCLRWLIIPRFISPLHARNQNSLRSKNDLIDGFCARSAKGDRKDEKSLDSIDFNQHEPAWRLARRIVQRESAGACRRARSALYIARADGYTRAGI